MASDTVTALQESELGGLRRRSMRNRDTLAGRGGCFHCLSTFVADCVTDWVDDGATALCPVCGIDAVLPGIGADVAVLEQMHERWFGSGHAVHPSLAEWDSMVAAGTLSP